MPVGSDILVLLSLTYIPTIKILISIKFVRYFSLNSSEIEVLSISFRISVLFLSLSLVKTDRILYEEMVKCTILKKRIFNPHTGTKL